MTRIASLWTILLAIALSPSLAIALAPPLIIQKAEIDQIFGTVREVLKTLA